MADFVEHSGRTCLLNNCSQLLIVNFSYIVLVTGLTGLPCFPFALCRTFLEWTGVNTNVQNLNTLTALPNVLQWCMYIFVFPSSVRKFEELNYRLSCSFFLYSRWKICYYQRCLKLYCRVNISATKLMILRGMAVKIVLYTGCPRQADHGIATFSVASSKPSLPIVLVATIMYYVTTIRYLQLTVKLRWCVSPYTLNCCMSMVNLNLFIVVSAVGMSHCLPAE